LKSIGFFNNKGGVGKTTLSCNIASFLNDQMKKRVLLIDADPQCNATQSILYDDICEEIYLSDTTDYRTLNNFVRPIEEGEPKIDLDNEPILGSQNRFNTDIIPGHPRMSIFEDRLSDGWSKSMGGEIGGILITNWCNDILRKFSDRYDIILFDLGPSLGALNRSVLLSCDYILTPLGCDIFSLLGINNMSRWISNWDSRYNQSIKLTEAQSPGSTNKYQVITSTETKFRLIGYSVQQYVTRTFKEGRRPVKAYDEIMKEIPKTIKDQLNFLMPSDLNFDKLELGHIPYLYSLIPMAQSAKTPIHKLENKDGVVGNQYKQVKDYAFLMESVCSKLLENMRV
jgi:ATPases involved in chromosome partitioning